MENQKKSPYRWQGKDLILDLHVQTRASKNAIVGLHGEKLKVTITAVPIEGKANQHLIKFLAQHFAVSLSQVKIIKGESNRHKLVSIYNPKNVVGFEK